MKFVDQAIIQVKSGKGGDGCLSFRREKFVPMGGPDGGDGGAGGSVLLEADSNLNTLVDFRHQRTFKAHNGEGGAGNQRSGKQGEDLIIKVPVGTIVFDLESGEQLYDLNHPGEKVCLAEGGRGGLGNVHFKSSTNRSPRKTIPGGAGQSLKLRLELKLLADVGLLGLPNAGKSTFIRAVSKARPKVADYPFTTLHPSLGVVSIDLDKSFVVADIPGLIEGASSGAGLGIDFLKHLARTSILLHLVDISGFDGTDPLESIKIITNEIEQFSPELSKKERWLVFNKIDLLPDKELAIKIKKILKSLKWKEPVFQISALKKVGTRELSYKLMDYFEAQKGSERP
jgi:GTPase